VRVPFVNVLITSKVFIMVVGGIHFFFVVYIPSFDSPLPYIMLFL